MAFPYGPDTIPGLIGGDRLSPEGLLQPIFVRPLTDAERQHVEAGLRSSEAFVLRQCQILLASARGERATAIARQLGCDDQTVREAIHAFNTN